MNFELLEQFVPKTYVNQGKQSIKTQENLIGHLLSTRRLPDDGWKEQTIEFLLQHLALMDSNNFQSNVGVGEREARIYCPMVERRHFFFGHGVGRSGDIAAVQPKAAGSSLIVQLTNLFAKEIIQLAGIVKIKAAIVLPIATGMSLALTLLTLKAKNPTAKYVIWSRIDQKSCFKSILTAGLEPIVIENLLEGDELRTDIDKIQQVIQERGAESILCVMTTSSCFAPRGCDKIVQVAELCRQHSIGHVINNAYGLQSSKCCHLINQAFRTGRVDAIIQSTDKNFMVPVGGAVICGPNKDFIEEIAKCYPGRASNTPTLDFFITMLYMGRNGYRKLLDDRKALVPYLVEQLERTAEAFGERLLLTPNNQISFAITLSNFADQDSSKTTFLGAKLFTRCVSGTRIVTGQDTKTIGSYQFYGFGAHTNTYPVPYLTAACAVGMTKHEVDVFIERLRKCLGECNLSKVKI